MNGKKISIIIPVFNMEKLIIKCVESVLNQTYRNLEIIIIDDGSSDQSGALCDAMAAKDERICVVHQNNRGIAGAINTGLERIHGEYLLFVDSDDYIAPEMVEKLLVAIEKYDADVAQCDRYSFTDIEGIPIKEQKDDIIVFESNNEIMNDFFHHRFISRNLAARLMKTSLFDGIRCAEGRLVVDIVTIPRILIQCTRYVYLSGKYYYVYEAQTSVSRGVFSQRRWDDMNYATAFFCEFINLRCPAFKDYIFYRYVDTAIYAYGGIWKNKDMPERSEKMKTCQKMFLEHYSGFMRTDYYKEKSAFYRCQLYLFRWFPGLYILSDILLEQGISLLRNIKYRIRNV